MADNYTNVSISGYNANPPPDDATTVTANALGWSKHTEKIGDPLKNAINDLDTNIDAAITALEAFVPPGVVQAYAGSTAPSGFVLCDGTSYNSVTDTSFANLFSVIGTDYGGTGAADFNVPDYRGEFLRGTDNGKSSDPDAASRTDRGDGTTGDAVGTRQSHAVDDHTHSDSFSASTNEPGPAGGGNFIDDTDTAPAQSGAGATINTGTSNVTAAINTTISGSVGNIDAGTAASTETRPRNVGVNWIIKK